MTDLIEALRHRTIATVEEVLADEISALLEPDAPQATALNTGVPAGFPRINGYVLVPHEGGATVCIVSSVRVSHRTFPKRRGTQQDFGLVDLPFPGRVMTVTPIGTLKVEPQDGSTLFKVRRGVDILPSVGDPVQLPTLDQLTAIVEGETTAAKRILVGYSPTAAQAPVHINPDKLFGRHVAILGNTGAGKSCSVAGLVRWSLEAAKKFRMATASQLCVKRDAQPNARFIILDPNGEYAHAFRDLDVRLFRVEPGTEGQQLRVPAWLWSGDEWAAFTEAAPGAQRPVLFEALRRLRSGLGPPEEFETKVRGRIKRYRSHLKVLVQGGDHQQSGKREGVAEFLVNLHTDFEKLADSPACTDSILHDSLQAAAVKARATEVAARGQRDQDGRQWHSSFSEVALDSVAEALGQAAAAVGLDDHDVATTDEDTPLPFRVGELPDYVDALAAGHPGRDIAQFVDTLSLRIRGLLSGRRLASVITPDNTTSITLEDWLTDYVGADGAENGPIAVIDLSLVPSQVIHVVVSVLARMVFEALQRYRHENGEELPTALVLEEAHTFVHRDLSNETASPSGRVCTRVFERIAREGRKFGLGLVLASQRPSEVSPTVLSQCNTFLLHRLVNDRDQGLVKRLVPDGLGSLLRELPNLPTKRAILLGWAAPAPVLIEMRDVPVQHRPHAPDPAFWDVWTGEEKRPIDWKSVSGSWQTYS